MKYAIGLDFGTLSARAVLFSCDDGSEVAEGVSVYSNGVLTEALPDGTPLGKDYALESTSDIRNSLKECISIAVNNSHVSPDDIIAIGIDATTYSQVVCDADGVPMCEKAQYMSEPMAWIKMWKHHGAQSSADRISAYHQKTGKIFQCRRYGGVFNCEWAFPKYLETYEKARQLFMDTSVFCDLGEWIAWLLTGKPVASLYSYGFKCLWSEDLGFPEKSALNELSDGFGDALYERLLFEPSDYSAPCGHLTEEAASWLGLKAGISVATPIGDGSTPGISICAKHRNSIAITYGTSVAMAFMSEELHELEGINGVVKDCYYPGFYAYDAGQPCAGDMLDWFVKGYTQNDHRTLTELACQNKPYQNKLTVLDWFAGNRSIINNSSLRGVIAGLGTDTAPSDIYCAMVQGICCGSVRAVRYFEENGLNFDKVIVFGGIADKNRFFLEQLASFMGKPVYYCSGRKITALGSAVLAAVAAGVNYDDALTAMTPDKFEEIKPDSEHFECYRDIYIRWCKYHDSLKDIV